jgi:hypothetical protein
MAATIQQKRCIAIEGRDPMRITPVQMMWYVDESSSVGAVVRIDSLGRQHAPAVALADRRIQNPAP